MDRTECAKWMLMAGLALGVNGCGAAPDEPEGEAALETSQEALFLLPNDVVLEWNAHATGALTEHDGYADPLIATRVLSMVHLAMHDAVNATAYRFHRPYAFKKRDVAAHPVAAAASAAHAVLIRLFPAQQAALSEKLDASLDTVPNGWSEKRGVALGRRVGEKLVLLRQNDGSDQTEPYTPGTEPGDYQFTTPDFIARPGWQNVTPWGLKSPDQFRPGPPPALDSAAYAAAYDDVKRRGDVNSTTRSEEETAYAKFWYEFSDIGWNRVTRVVAEQEHLGLAGAARLFALVNMAMADSYIAGWDAKFHYDFWRPITAIQDGDADGNPATAADPNWSPLLGTPPVQDYPSTHSVLGAAAAEVLTRYFGRHGDRIGFSMTSSTASEPNVEMRSFASFRQASAENADSRVAAGLHFPFACDAGLDLGAQIGRYVFEKHLQSRR